MAKRGIYKHLKRIHAPKSWMLSKVGGIWSTKPSQGPHKLRESIPLSLILRNKLKIALNAKEAKLITKSKEGIISVDGKVRKDPRFPIGFMDILTINKTKQNYRITYDVKGRFRLNKIAAEEAKYKLCKVLKKATGPNGCPYVVTDDARTIRFPKPEIKENDTIKFNLEKKEIVGFYKYEIGSQVMINGGNNVGRCGTIIKIEKHPGSYEIVYIKDLANKEFSTKLSNVFVIGEKNMEIPAEKFNTRLSVIEERKIREGNKIESSD